MDVRLSPEQEALRHSVAQVVERLGPKTVADLDDAERSAKLDAAVDSSGWRELRTAGDGGAPWASGVESAIVAEELARGMADAAFVGPTLAAELRRLTGALAATTSETVALTADLGGLGAEVAVDAAGATGALALVADDVVQLSLAGLAPAAVDLTRPSSGVGVATSPIGALSRVDLTRWTALGLALTCADLVGTMRGPHLRLFEAIGRVHPQVLGRTLPLNGAGTCGAALADLGLPPDLLRGFALLARTAGLLGQLAEEQRRPVGMDVYLTVEHNTEYLPPDSAADT